MLTRFFVFVCCIFFLSTPIKAQLFITGQDAKSTALRYLRMYDPDGYAIVRSFLKSPDAFQFDDVEVQMSTEAEISSYLDSSDHWSLIRSLNTVVHEMAHTYTHHVVFNYMQRNGIDLKMGEHHSLFYLGKKDQILVKHSPTFPSAEINNNFPDSLKTSRYHTYVYPQSKLSTQTIGIYGLLDEWHGYYLGTQNAVRMLPYFKNREADNQQRWFQYFYGVHSTYLSYLEFKLFILHYLDVAESNHPDIFREIVANKKFVEVYLRIEQQYGELLDGFFAFKKKQLQGMMMAGVNCGEDDEFIYIGPWGQQNFLAEFKRLSFILTQSPYKEIYESLEKALPKEYETIGN